SSIKFYVKFCLTLMFSSPTFFSRMHLKKSIYLMAFCLDLFVSLFGQSCYAKDLSASWRIAKLGFGNEKWAVSLQNLMTIPRIRQLEDRAFSSLLTTDFWTMSARG
ncbi:MAG: hypothetical protein U9P79_02590, partial [Candidatus Cloacimonadota bacterium]|nr:hypothetical protein [Candidatus Cloacimonadota bacterium]